MKDFLINLVRRGAGVGSRSSTESFTPANVFGVTERPRGADRVGKAEPAAEEPNFLRPAEPVTRGSAESEINPRASKDRIPEPPPSPARFLERQPQAERIDPRAGFASIQRDEKAEASPESRTDLSAVVVSRSSELECKSSSGEPSRPVELGSPVPAFSELAPPAFASRAVAPIAPAPEMIHKSEAIKSTPARPEPRAPEFSSGTRSVGSTGGEEKPEAGLRPTETPTRTSPQPRWSQESSPLAGRLIAGETITAREGSSVQVKIGRVELRITKPAAPSSPAASPASPSRPRGFDNYAQARRYLDRRWY